jgi:hypothetical protein
MAKVSEIQSHLERLLSGQISLHEFSKWFVPYGWNAHLESDANGAELAEQIDDVLVESQGDSLELRAALKDILVASQQPKTVYEVFFAEGHPLILESVGSSMVEAGPSQNQQDDHHRYIEFEEEFGRPLLRQAKRVSSTSLLHPALLEV